MPVVQGVFPAWEGWMPFPQAEECAVQSVSAAPAHAGSTARSNVGALVDALLCGAQGGSVMVRGLQGPFHVGWMGHGHWYISRPVPLWWCPTQKYFVQEK